MIHKDDNPTKKVGEILDKYVVIDLETTGHAAAAKDKIIEVGMVIIQDDKIVDEYTTFLHPEQTIPPFISNLTGITDEDVAEAPTFTACADHIVDLFKDSYLIAHNVPFDLGFLNAELKASGRKPLSNPSIDTVELARILYPDAPGYKLGQLAAYLEIEHDDPHRALSDAFVTAKLFIMLKKKLHTLPYETIVQLRKLTKELHSDLHTMLEELEEQLAFAQDSNERLVVYRGLAFRKQDEVMSRTVTDVISFGTFLDDLYSDDGIMQQSMAHYEKREGQRHMSEEVYHAFQSEKHALIEAETGTGKSIGYLLPAIYEAVKTNKRIVISTYTTQLQSQLLHEEIPSLQKWMPFPFRAALLKGKQHYISLEKFEQELQNEQQGNYDVALAKAIILVWLTETETGDIEEINLPSSGYLFFKRISSESESFDPLSPWMMYSYYQHARKKAQRADLIITNHALLCTDMMNEYQFLPSYERVIIDEAHHFETTASHHHGKKLDYRSMLYSFNQIGTSDEDGWLAHYLSKYPQIKQQFPIEQWDAIFYDVKHEMDDLFRTIFQYVIDKRKQDKSLSDIGRIQYRYHAETEANDAWHDIIEMVGRLMVSIRDLIHLLSFLSVQERENGEGEQATQAVQAFQQYIDHLEHLFLEPEEAARVKWIEIEALGARNAVYLYSEPTDISSWLANDFFAVKKSVILTSATLTMRKSFSFIEKSLGIPSDRLITEIIASPFSYDKQVKLLIPNDFPDIKYDKLDDFIYSTAEAILSLSKITSGRMLVLFTSYDMLRKSYHLLKEMMEANEYNVIAQGISSGSRERLKKNFQTFERAILLGTSSFWEGIDIPGEDLSCLVIVRLPFQPPDHPVYEAKSTAMRVQNNNPFYELSLPNAVIRFKQGFGRLIRSKRDRGIVFVCDARLKKARYGNIFLSSIPAVPMKYASTTALMEEAEKWF